MASIFRRIFRLWGGSTASTTRSHGPSIDTNFSVFREGDCAVLKTPKGQPVFSNRLRKDRKTRTPHGAIEHNDIIGKNTRGLVRTRKGPNYRVTYPTLKEYVELTPRIATPIYPADANLIVSLLDIHTTSGSNQRRQHEKLEILEAGTGHGSLALHLARAIHAANTCPPPIPKTSQCRILSEEQTESSSSSPQDSRATEVDPLQRDWDEWREQRGAVLHTVDTMSTHSSHAEKVVRGFRRGLYAGNVDFNVSSVENWIQEQYRQRSNPLRFKSPDPFLSYAILDMPSPHIRIPKVAPLLKPDGILAVFVPQITQILECVNIISEQGIPLHHDRTVELGTGISGGKLWDVRRAPKRSKPDNPEKPTEESSEGRASDESGEETSATQGARETESVVSVCRPKVGERIVGGGFVGIWQRQRD